MMNYLIWSHEHGAWWGPHSRGYTYNIAQAGRYTREEAMAICADARVGHTEPYPEIPVREEDVI